jgi:hypothetical protein
MTNCGAAGLGDTTSLECPFGRDERIRLHDRGVRVPHDQIRQRGVLNLLGELRADETCARMGFCDSVDG